jgi:hypothetical protein
MIRHDINFIYKNFDKLEMKRFMNLKEKMAIKYFIKNILLVVFTLILTQKSWSQTLSNNGAVMSVSDNFVVSGGSGNLINTSGTINNDGDLNFGASFSNGGTVNGNGIYLIGGSFSNTGTVNFGTSTFHYNGSVGQNVADEAYYNLECSGIGDKTAMGDIAISGDFTNDATFVPVTHNVTFNSAVGAQTIGGSSSISFYGLTIDNAVGGVTISNPAVVVSNQLTLTNGIVTASTVSSFLTINDGATSNAGNDTSYVTGIMTKIGIQPFTFPVGEGDFWAPIGLSGWTAGDATTAFEARYNAAAGTNLGAWDRDALTYFKVSNVEFWDLDHSAGTAPTVNVTLHWKDQSRSATAIEGDAVSTDLVVAHYNTGLGGWENGGQSAVTDGVIGSVTSLAMSSFSPVTFGSRAIDFRDISLPVELITFEAIDKEGIAEISWITASEINNGYYVVERSYDGVNFVEVERIYVNGNSYEEKTYKVFDLMTEGKVHYYRLLQVDIGGEETYSRVVTIYSAPVQGVSMSLFPNPVSKHQNVIVHIDNNTISTNATLSLLDFLGRVIFVSEKPLIANAKNIINVDNFDSLSDGVYVVRVKIGNKQLEAKLVIE